MRVIAVILTLLGMALPAQAQTGPAAPAVPVGTVAAERRDISESREFVGRIEAPQRVEIRARVKGFLEEVLFKEGDVVQAGAPLYRIEKGLFEADVKQAEGALIQSQAALELAQIQLQRAQDLLDRNAGTVVARDQARALAQQSQGAVEVAQANLTTARINLGYTEILAPITGLIGRTVVTKGNVVGPDSGALTTMVSQDPMYVVFPVSQRDLLQYTSGAAKVDPRSIAVKVLFANGTTYDQVGRINFVDISVDRTTDTQIVRADIPNPKGGLTDGQFARVLLESGKSDSRVVVPQAALIADQAGVYVFIVEDGKAAVRRLKVGGQIGPGSIVDEGLSGGEQVIVEGLQGVRPGSAVRATPIAKSASGI
ncbi:MAG: efflux transporter periplasmic adaptor subunit [Chelatococcus sp.]|nr:MAG: efflux transporter periplasmic adaptor subunit [Chelatococcus sp.]